MTIKELIDSGLFKTINVGDDTDRNITQGSNSQCIDIPHDCDPYAVFRCLAHGNAQQVTAEKSRDVAALCDVGCIVLAEGISLDDAARAKAVQQHITVLSTDMPIFDAALKVHERIHA